jgi:hypothetical protein
LVEEGIIATVVSLVAVPMEGRPRVIREVLTRLVEVEERLGRPHAVVLDEAHHAFPADAPVDAGVLPPGLVLVSNTPRGLQRDLFDRLESVVAVGDDARAMLEQAAEAIGARLSVGDAAGEAVAWRLDEGHVRWFTPVSARHRRRRHSAKMLSGDVGEGERLVVTGPEGTLSLEVRNLSELVRIAEGVDDATWWHHLREGDWSRWVRDAIGDADLADAIETFAAKDLDLAAGRRALREEVAVRYPGLEEA